MQMIAILVCTGQNPQLHGMDERVPTPLLPLVDRPFLQHIVEYLVWQGVRQFEILLSHLPEKIENHFGTGTRWGCQIHFHLCPNPDQPYKLVKNVARGLMGPFILGSSDYLPLVDFNKLPSGQSLQFFHRGSWTRWAWFEASTLRDVLPENDSRPNGPLPGGKSVGRSDVQRCLSTASPLDLLAAQRSLLDGAVPELMIGGNHPEPGVWISRNVSVHPAAALHAPLYIGANCEIGAGAQIGPFAAIGENCIVDRKSMVVDSLVAPGTYIGEGLELDQVIVDRNRLVNARLGTSCLISEEFLLGGLTLPGPGALFVRGAARVAAGLLFALLSPAFLITAGWLTLTRKGHLESREFVRLPAGESPRSWQTARLLYFRLESDHSTDSSHWTKFLLEFLPGLISVVAGRMRIAGVPPRTAAEILALPSDRRSLYRNSKAGLITEADIMFGQSASEEEIYSAEAFYAATPTFSHDLRLFRQYLWRLFASGPRHAVESESALDSRV